MFQDFDQEEKQALFILVNLNLPSEECVFSVENIPSEVCDSIEEVDELKLCWSYDVMKAFSEELNLPQADLDAVSGAYFPLVLTNYNTYKQIRPNERSELCMPYVSLLVNERVSNLTLYIKILIFFVLRKKLDGRGRVVMRNLLHSLSLSSYDGIWTEFLLCKYMKEQQDKAAYEYQQRPDKYRYAKIGGMAVGVGLVLAITGGLCAPLIAMGINTIGMSAAGITWLSMALLFGGAGAGLSGYKMIARTRGLTEFSFKQYDEKNKMAIMIMISGWLDEEEDDKMAFGVLPEELTLTERLYRFYQLYAPERLKNVETESECFAEDPNAMLKYLGEKYGIDPTDPDVLIPPKAEPPSSLDCECYLDIITTTFDQLKQQEEAKMKTNSVDAYDSYDSDLNSCQNETTSLSNPNNGSSGPLDLSPENLAAASKMREEAKKKQHGLYHDLQDLMMAATSTTRSADDLQEVDVDSNHEDGADEINPLAPSSATTTTSSSRRPATHRYLDYKLSYIKDDAGGGGRVEEVEVKAVDEGEDRNDDDEQMIPEEDSIVQLQNNRYWHWRNLAISSVYELTLLHWEKKLQKELGQSMMKLYLSLGYYTAEAIVTSIPFFWMLATAAMAPVAMLEMTAFIDNLWTIACERADEAGRELARALLTRSDDARPVTLVGFSMGARIIFSCLRELSKRLPKPEEVPGEEVPPNGIGEDDERYVNNSESSTGSSVEEGGVNMGNSDGQEKEEGEGELCSPLASGVPSSTASPVQNVNLQTTSSVSAVSSIADSTIYDKNIHIDVKHLKGMIQDVVLLGAPIELNHKHWSRVRAVVAGRLINGYSPKDAILSIVYRYERTSLSSTAGLSPVTSAEGIENVDLSHTVAKHTDYGTKMKEILRSLDLAGCQPIRTS
mmetsp:Transcript_24904/g.41639  ORF Transcript_24904/g.41639 Transcript_24904/m.41639 type:complete len:896 (-) Transcript_24904:180-2867(-)|eukprot:CAMPEP_0174988884 /NCGR_PEP_ID=MMETSP0004_2-20121128/20391_1 /TAXON_ID=420556 /ORGANISM="Ochromonas sp., Strain CCMP1393" /LENGTH=895 /DNA_ID=CAMNT_0016242185 /DNA_START=42 /DNA_END=2729 /DNA_ORIENTATION=-